MSSAGGEEDKKPAGGDGGIHINLKVKGQVCTTVPHPPLPPTYHFQGCARPDRHTLIVQSLPCGIDLTRIL
jgi:hypothetical protein